MNKLALAIVMCSMLTGCAGLNVSWSLIATYNTPHSVPGAPVPAESK